MPMADHAFCSLFGNGAPNPLEIGLTILVPVNGLW